MNQPPSHAPQLPPIDAARLSEWLSQHGPQFEGPLLDIEAFSGGQSNPTYRIRSAKHTWVMRTKPAPQAQLLKSAHAIEREYRVLKALEHSSIAVPRVHLLCEDESVIGRAFFIMEYLSGRVLWDPSMPQLEPLARFEHYKEMNRVISELHQLDPKALGLESFGKGANYFERQIKRWSEQYQNSITEDVPEMTLLMEKLPQSIPRSAQEPTVALVHGDFRLDNLIFAPEHARVLGVLDWELSTLGHPLADFSYHCMSWHISPTLFRGIAGLDLKALGIPQERQYIEWYCEHTQLYEPNTLSKDWDFYLAYNLFRMASILQGIAWREQAGTASSAQAKQAGQQARPMAQLAWEYAMRLGV
jgi:aminoglycoside phosphotransferase (APT) family kinase protein